MGFAFCRFKQETGCSETGSTHYWVQLHDIGIGIDVPEMWKHYMTEHFVQPTKRERYIVMRADVDLTDGIEVGTLGKEPPGKRPEFEQVLYVEKKGDTYSHRIGTEPDTEFIGKLERILAHVDATQTKGL